jgi:hypothetical protein
MYYLNIVIMMGTEINFVVVVCCKDKFSRAGRGVFLVALKIACVRNLKA